MSSRTNPHAEQMAAESMHRTLAAQAEAIWPQEVRLLRDYGLAEDTRVFDLGCGPGEVSQRVLQEFPTSTLIGLDIDPRHIQVAKERCERFGARASFQVGDAFETGLADDSVDLSLCRHILQSLPDAPLVLKELARITRPGGRIHVLAEDYGMIYFHPTELDCDRFWREGPITFSERTGTDLRSGRKVFTILSELGLKSVRVDYVRVDTCRVPREVFIRIWEAWRDGYADVIAEHTEFSLEEVTAHWNDMLACLHNPSGYALWNLPVISGVVPA